MSATIINLKIVVPDGATYEAREFIQVLWGCLWDCDRQLAEETDEWQVSATYERVEDTK